MQQRWVRWLCIQVHCTFCASLSCLHRSDDVSNFSHPVVTISSCGFDQVMIDVNIHGWFQHAMSSHLLRWFLIIVPVLLELRPVAYACTCLFLPAMSFASCRYDAHNLHSVTVRLCHSWHLWPLFFECTLSRDHGVLKMSMQIVHTLRWHQSLLWGI